MATFTSKTYPGLTLQDETGVWAQFAGGTFETSDAAVVKRLRALPEDEGIAEAKAPAKGDSGAKE
ncbi:hypothetical protein [Streptomyces sp. NPDC060198]|uniref:hypothetical protein n=1 Tax=Streptomyces sp. NPDC060198 TaxID=3347070 RepID=UPI00364981F1